MSVDSEIYEGSDGQYYGNVDIWQRLEAEEWRPIDWDRESGMEVVKTIDGKLLELEPVSESSLPKDVELVETEVGVMVEHCRR